MLNLRVGDCIEVTFKTNLFSMQERGYIESCKQIHGKVLYTIKFADPKVEKEVLSKLIDTEFHESFVALVDLEEIESVNKFMRWITST